MWPYSTGSMLEGMVGQALPQTGLNFGALAGGQQAQQQPAPQPSGPSQAEPSRMNKILSNPQLMSALGRMGSAISRSNDTGASFGASLGSGFDAFQDENIRQRQEAQQAQQMEAQRRLLESRAQEAERDAKYGIKSGGFEGDMARARVVMNDPNSTDEQRATAQAVMETAQRMQGSYNPVTGNFDYNKRTTFGGDPYPQGATSYMPPAQNGGMSPAPMGNGDLLLPPPSEGAGSPDFGMFPANSGNPKVEAALMEEEGKAKIAGRRAVNEGVAKADTETFSAIANQTRTLSSMLPQLQRIETLAENTKTGGVGAARLEFGKMFGLDLDGVPEAQAITAIQNAIGPSLRTPGSGASSDKDVAIFMSSIPTLMNTPGGIREINKTYSQLLDRKKEEEKIARRLLREDGDLERFYEETEKLGPVFKSDRSQSTPQTGSGTAPKRLRFNPQTGNLE